ncbi:uncharacterized protein LOC141659894 [Apium graveolens]|uniref:uncharacterized protein LOC141659894 n=1 Tax=Apium graveolens TaxID=4045 RepID=UPI003D79FE94
MSSLKSCVSNCKGYDGSANHLVEGDVYTETRNITELHKECAEYSSGGNSNSSWASSCTSEDDFRFSEAPVHKSVPLENDEPDYPSRTLGRSRDAYARLMDLPPQKLVPIGSDYQADIPEWRSYGSNDSGVNNKFCGTCVTPMPAMELIMCDDYKSGYGRSICICVDPGSITCVRHHVVKAREDIRRLVGQECFAGLGLNEMGEVVAERWSEEDEQIFEEVVMSNTSSAGKNFWDRLSEVFPSRTEMEIVSYYFNVFMLRKRAKQNRSKSMNIDSDDDEWQESEDEFEGCENDTESEEDEDSVVEYPACEGIPGWNGINAGSCEYGTGVVKDTSHQYNTDIGDLDGIYSLSETWKHNDYGTYPMFSPSQTLVDVWGNHDLNNHSPSGTGSELQASKMKAGHSKSFAATFNGASAKGGHDFFPGPCDDKVWGDDKVWDFGYAPCRSNDVEFLSTSNVMEVFGVEDFIDKARDDKLH